MATSLDKMENKIQIHHLHVTRFHTVKRLWKSVQYIWRYLTKCAIFWPCHTWRSQMSSQLCSYWTEFHEIFTWYRGVICAVNAHIEIAISHSVSEWHSNKCRGVGNFATKLVAMAMSLEESEKLDWFDNIHTNTFHLVKKILKIGPIDPEIALINLKKERKKWRKVKYIARTAGLPSGLNKLMCDTATIQCCAETWMESVHMHNFNARYVSVNLTTLSYCQLVYKITKMPLTHNSICTK